MIAAGVTTVIKRPLNAVIFNTPNATAKSTNTVPLKNVPIIETMPVLICTLILDKASKSKNTKNAVKNFSMRFGNWPPGRLVVKAENTAPKNAVIVVYFTVGYNIMQINIMLSKRSGFTPIKIGGTI